MQKDFLNMTSKAKTERKIYMELCIYMIKTFVHQKVHKEK